MYLTSVISGCWGRGGEGIVQAFKPLPSSEPTVLLESEMSVKAHGKLSVYHM